MTSLKYLSSDRGLNSLKTNIKVKSKAVSLSRDHIPLCHKGQRDIGQKMINGTNDLSMSEAIKEPSLLSSDSDSSIEIRQRGNVYQ